MFQNIDFIISTKNFRGISRRQVIIPGEIVDEAIYYLTKEINTHPTQHPTINRTIVEVCQKESKEITFKQNLKGNI